MGSSFAGRVALGLFILTQLSFIVLANLGTVALYLGNAGNAGATIAWNVIGTFTEPYALATGQEQYWRMFAPETPRRALFVRLRLHTGDGVETLPSECEPLPGQSQFHLPGSGERMWHVEKNLAAPFMAFDPDEIARKPDEWRAYLKSRVAANRHRYLAYMNWKTRQLGDRRASDRVELLVSIHTPSRFDRFSEAEFEELLLRWAPAGNTLEVCAKTANGMRCEPLDPE